MRKAVNSADNYNHLVGIDALTFVYFPFQPFALK